jgi:hypothetical protein
MGRDFLDLWTRLTEDAGDVRCVVLTGAGDKVFCAGADLKEHNGMTREQWQRQHELFERHYWALTDLPLPVIAAVNGHAYAGGFEAVLSCDFAYAVNTARFALTEVTLGIMPAPAAANLPRAVGERRAKEIIMTARPFSAQQRTTGASSTRCTRRASSCRRCSTPRAPSPATRHCSPPGEKSVRYGMQMELKTASASRSRTHNHLVETEDATRASVRFAKAQTGIQGK